jgi:CubicO group peptidase (beta-lactamase class C family)
MVVASGFGWAETTDVGGVPVHPVAANAAVDEWVVLGPFPNPEPTVPVPGADYRQGFHADYLKPLGGEGQAAIAPGVTVPFLSGETSATLAQANELHEVDFIKLYGKGLRVAYAFAYLSAEENQKAYIFFGSNDCAKIWINGQLVNSFWKREGRACVAGEDVFQVDLRKGLNPVLVKVEDAGGAAWEFIFEVYDAQGVKAKDAAKEESTRLKQFQQAAIVPENGMGFILPTGALPDLQWEDSAYVAAQVGETPLQTTWYNARLRRVDTAKKPGRYAAVVEGHTPGGLHVRRALTFYCAEPDWTPPVEEANVYLQRLPLPYELKEQWLNAAEQLAQVGELKPESRGIRAQATILAALDELRGLERPLAPTDAPDILDGDYHLKLRLKLLDHKPQGLALPQTSVTDVGPVLRPGTAVEAGVAEDTAEKLDALFTEWYAQTDVPFTTLIARNGVVIIEKSYGPKAINAKTPFWIASITKAVTGVMFAQFVEQGLVGIDDPVGAYLPDFPVEGDHVLTLRHCFTHTSGLSSHAEWGGLQNPWLDNVIATGVAYLQPGRVREYNGMGLDLAGKVMETVAGKSILRLMHENFFMPLGLGHSGVSDLGGYMYCSAEDLARIGQLLANRGAYGDRVFFSQPTLDKLMPVQLGEIYPGISSEWGVGIASMREPHPMAGQGDVPESATLLGYNVIGHGAASSSIFRVDLDNNLVIVQTRNETGKDYDAFARRLYQLLDESLTPQP